MTHNLEYYKVFYYVAKNASVTAAATELSISQPAVSQAIRQLENLLEVKLFSRSAKGVSLTSEGRVLYSYVEKGYEQIQTGERKVKQMLQMEAGEVCIGASDMTLQFYLLPYLEKFHEKYPLVKVTVTNGPTPETIQMLKEDKIDFGVVSTPIESEKGISFDKVKEIRDTFVGGRKFFAWKNKTLDLSELTKLPLIFLEGETSTRSYMEAFLKQNDVEIAPEFELATSDMIVQFALKNLGIGCVMEEFAKPYIKEGKLFELRFNKKIPGRSFVIARREGAPVSLAASHLLNLMKEDLK